jgi:hypothetical protein
MTPLVTPPEERKVRVYGSPEFIPKNRISQLEFQL